MFENSAFLSVHSAEVSPFCSVTSTLQCLCLHIVTGTYHPRKRESKHEEPDTSGGSEEGFLGVQFGGGKMGGNCFSLRNKKFGSLQLILKIQQVNNIYHWIIC